MGKSLVSGDLTPGHFPRQKKAWSQKGTEFFKENVDAGVSMSGWHSKSSIRDRKSSMKANYDLLNNKVAPEEIKAVVNPFRMEGFDPTVNYENYPLINANLAVLVGEETKRLFRPLVTVLNSDVINEQLETINTEFTKFAMQKVLSKKFDETETEEGIKKFEKWRNFTYRDKRARMADQMLEYFLNTGEVKTKFNRGFEDLMTCGEEIYIIDIVSGEPVVRRGNPLNFTIVRSGESYKVEDADIIIEDGYRSLGTVIDEYHEFLTEPNIKKLEEGLSMHRGNAGILFRDQLLHEPIDYNDYVESVGMGSILAHTDTRNRGFANSFDSDGNVRVVRVVWKSMRKVGFITYYDEDGDEQVRIVDETYKPRKDLGEKVEWKWISEWYEGTRIADDIYVKMQPREIQFRSMTNPSECHPGIVGTMYNINDSKVQSFVGLLRPYQLTFNAFMHKLKKAFAKHKGNMPIINTSMIPAGWTMDQWMFYAEEMGWGMYNPFNEGNKGAAMGKLAGNMSSTQTSINSDQSSIINSTLVMLEFLKAQIDEISGITPQRKGAIENRETARGIERSVTQSSLNTEKYFAVHEDLKLRVARAWVETAKVAWSTKKFKRAFILDDNSQAILDFDSQIFNESEYGVYVSNSLEHKEMMQALRGLSQSFLQNNGSLAIVADLYRTTDPASLQRKIETYEEQIRTDAENARKQELEAQQAQVQAKVQFEQEKLRIEEENNIRKDATERYKAELAALDTEEAVENDDLSKEKLDLDTQKVSNDLDIKNRTLDETIRSNKQNEAIKKKSAANKPVTVKSKK